MRGFLITMAQLGFAVMMYAMGAVFFGAALVPGLGLLMRVVTASAAVPVPLRLFMIGVTLAAGYFLFGLTLVLLVGLFRVIFRLRLPEGTFPLFSFRRRSSGPS